MVKVRYVPNWHNKNTPETQIGYMVVTTPYYKASWEYCNPQILEIRGENQEESEWVQWQIGGYCEGTEGEHLPNIESFTAVFAKNNLLFAAPTVFQGNDDEDVANKAASFTVDSYAGGQYTYTFIFGEKHIECQLIYKFQGEITLRKAHIGTLKPEKKSFFQASTIFNPNPMVNGIYYHSLNKKVVVGSTSDKWFTPSAFCFPIQLKSGRWMSVSPAPTLEELQFTSFMTDPGAYGELGFVLDYTSEPTYKEIYHMPSMVLRFASRDPFEALKDYADGLVELRKIEPVVREQQHWWKGVMICGWHNQNGSSTCTQERYESHVAKYEEVDIPWDILTIDDFWGKEHGIWEVNTEKWPDLRGFIEAQHERNRKVLLWICINTTGLPEDELYKVGEQRLLDPCNPKYLERMKKAFVHMLGDGEGCLNADGIKLDFTGGVPAAGEASCTKKLYGMEYLYTQFKAFHDGAKAVKPDCLLDFQVANPHFAALHDMTRLNDFYLSYDQALEPMRTRAKIAHSVTFGGLVDTDHPEDNEYYRHSHEFGNLCLYLSNEALDTKKEMVEIIKETIKKLFMANNSYN